MRTILKVEKIGDTAGVRASDKGRSVVWLGSDFAGVRGLLGDAEKKFYWAEIYADTLEIEEEAPWQNW